MDASHPDIWLDLNRCILCKLCVRASHEIDGKGRVRHRRARHWHPPAGQFAQRACWATARLAAEDHAAHICPVGAILPKRRGFAVPIGERPFRHAPPRPWRLPTMA
ncbi:MAG: hypothetical protein V9G23_02635 [Giesbergeria sp.]